MKLGWWYVTLIVAATGLVVAAAYLLEIHEQQWVLAHPILDGAIGGAIIIPLAGLGAVLIIDRRVESQRRRDRLARASIVKTRLSMALRQAIRGAFYGIVATAAQTGSFTSHTGAELLEVLDEVEGWTRTPSEKDVERVREVVLPYLERSTALLQEFADLAADERARQFADLLMDSSDWLKLSLTAADKGVNSRFFEIFSVSTRMCVLAAEKVCPGSLPLSAWSDPPSGAEGPGREEAGPSLKNGERPAT